jgi:hypothetical protein
LFQLSSFDLGCYIDFNLLFSAFPEHSTSSVLSKEFESTEASSFSSLSYEIVHELCVVLKSFDVFVILFPGSEGKLSASSHGPHVNPLK